MGRPGGHHRTTPAADGELSPALEIPGTGTIRAAGAPVKRIRDVIDEYGAAPRPTEPQGDAS